MRRELKKIKAENAALAQRVQAGRENIAQTEQHVSTTVNEWKVRKKTRIKCKCKNFVSLKALLQIKSENIQLFVVHNWCLISVCVLKLICLDNLSLKMHLKTQCFVKR